MFSLRLPAIACSLRHYGTDLAGAFQELKIVPEVIDQAPPRSLDVRYCGKKICGECLTPSFTKSKPKVTWPADKCGFYTLSLIDPDVPCHEHPNDREFNHWLVVNIRSNIVSDGCTVVDYIGPLPKKGTANHRYVMLLFKQKCQRSFQETPISCKCLRGRKCFFIREFADKYNLGNPVRGMVFYASWDKYVDKKMKQLTKGKRCKKSKKH